MESLHPIFCVPGWSPAAFIDALRSDSWGGVCHAFGGDSWDGVDRARTGDSRVVGVWHAPIDDPCAFERPLETTFRATRTAPGFIDASLEQQPTGKARIAVVARAVGVEALPQAWA